jgi:hypothetical protein
MNKQINNCVYFIQFSDEPKDFQMKKNGELHDQMIKCQ